MREVAAALSEPRSSAGERYYKTPGLPTPPALPGQRNGAEPVQDREHEIADQPDVHAVKSTPCANAKPLKSSPRVPPIVKNAGRTVQDAR